MLIFSKRIDLANRFQVIPTSTDYDVSGTDSNTPTLVRHTGQQRLVGIADDIRMSVHPLQQHGASSYERSVSAPELVLAFARVSASTH